MGKKKGAGAFPGPSQHRGTGGDSHPCWQLPSRWEGRKEDGRFFLQRPEIINTEGGVDLPTIYWGWKRELPSVLLVAINIFRSIAFIPGHEVLVVEKKK